jgi:pSer/pThr/pTyr-binding forkhead associated (FHA) protein
VSEAVATAPAAHLVTRLGRLRVDRFAVKEPETVIGSLAEVGVPISAEGVSRRHAKLTHDGKRWWLEPLSTRAGTFLNGVLVIERERVRHLDVITLGRNVHLVFVTSAAEATGAAKPPGIVRAALVREGGEGVATEIPLGEVTLGRSSSNTFMAPSRAVSKIHARIQRTTHQLVLEDLGSPNGTFVNDERVTTAVLRDGDTVCLAAVPEARFLVQIETAEAVGGEPAAPARAEALAARQTGSLPRPAAAEWRTRYDYDSVEIAGMAELRRGFNEQREGMRREAAAGKPSPTAPSPPPARDRGDPAGGPERPAQGRRAR